MTLENYAVSEVIWQPGYRVTPTRFPSVNLFDRVASPEDFEALYALEALTNDRIRDEVGTISLVPRAERLFGPGSGPIMAALTHLNPSGSRFSDGSFGVFYCAREDSTAIAETRYHTAQFLAYTNEAPITVQMRLYSVAVAGNVIDLRGDEYRNSGVFHPSDYSAGQQLGGKLRNAGAPGVVYPSVRAPNGQCVAGFRTSLFRQCVHSAYLHYQWDGTKIANVFSLVKLDV